ncbi:hypothetical protein B4Q04_18340 [Zobellia sp. OII3]|uniref:tyrosine-type recombinase/integrase n=1 Tax=Zobellia sp. OII3 TaxID=2034520 RepID=UPI000B52E36B|nr:phage integrase SAM-like domain-containing protein [Zobellia sp. OII3]OWW24063.1 hypothetical protein B4Q04_18340 [Zobellia sp. OII3]
MATTAVYTVNKSSNASIYIRLSIKRGLMLRQKTGLSISYKDWGTKSGTGAGLPKQNSAYNKNLTTDLQKLKVTVSEKYNEASANGINVSNEWLRYVVDLHFKRITEDKQSDLLVDAIQNVIDTANIRENAHNGLGLSKSRISSYKNLLNIIKVFQGRRILKVKDVNIQFGKEFLNWMMNTKHYSESYARKKIDDLKTVCNDAEIYGVQTSGQLRKIKGGKPKNEGILYLSENELDKIKSANLINDAHKNVRKWILLGCHIGQRGGDLLKLTKDNFVTRSGLEVIELKQQKTGKNVTIPVLPTTKEILKTGLPYKIALQRLNEKIKEVCRIAGIDEPVKGGKVVMVDSKGNEIARDGKGNYIERGVKRKIAGTFAKYELMTSHVCRRSFATNLYGKLPTPLIMQITAHGTEKMFLNYIGKSSLDYAQQIADFYTLQAQKEKKESQLNVIKNASNE